MNTGKTPLASKTTSKEYKGNTMHFTMTEDIKPFLTSFTGNRSQFIREAIRSYLKQHEILPDKSKQLVEALAYKLQISPAVIEAYYWVVFNREYIKFSHSATRAIIQTDCTSDNIFTPEINYRFLTEADRRSKCDICEIPIEKDDYYLNMDNTPICVVCSINKDLVEAPNNSFTEHLYNEFKQRHKKHFSKKQTKSVII